VVRIEFPELCGLDRVPKLCGLDRVPRALWSG
jgi:hypothetical protein